MSKMVSGRRKILICWRVFGAISLKRGLLKSSTTLSCKHMHGYICVYIQISCTYIRKIHNCPPRKIYMEGSMWPGLCHHRSIEIHLWRVTKYIYTYYIHTLYVCTNTSCFHVRSCTNKSHIDSHLQVKNLSEKGFILPSENSPRSKVMIPYTRNYAILSEPNGGTQILIPGLFPH